MNPLNIPAVRDLVLQHVGRHLLNIRLLNSSWNSKTSALLQEAGWKVHLRNAEEVEEFLRLDKAAAASRGGGAFSISSRPNLDLSLKLDLAARPEILDTAIAIIERGYGVQSLEIKVGVTGLDSGVLHLIKRVSSGLRCLKLQVQGTRTNNGSAICAHLESPLVLPALQSLHITTAPPSVAGHVPALRKIVLAASGLQSLHVNGGKYSCCREALGLIASITDTDSRARLLALEIFERGRSRGFAQFAEAANTRHVRFERLRVLRINCPLFGWSRYGGAFLAKPFLDRCCPNLTSLEFVDVVEKVVSIPHPRFTCGISRDSVWELAWLKVPPMQIPAPAPAGDGMTHIAFHTANIANLCNGVKNFLPVIGSLDNFLSRTPQDYTGLTSVTMNLDAFLTIVQTFAQNGAFDGTGASWELPKVFVQMTWPSVTRLTVETGVTAMEGIYGFEEDKIPYATAFYISKTYPNLEELVVNLGVDSECGLHQVLPLVFGVCSLKRAEISNFCGTLPALKEAAPAQVSSVQLQCNGISALETLIIRGSAKQASGVSTASISIQGLLALIPEPAKAGLVLEVEAELFYNWKDTTGRSMSFKDILTEVQSLKSPRVRLV